MQSKTIWIIAPITALLGGVGGFYLYQYALENQRALEERAVADRALALSEFRQVVVYGYGEIRPENVDFLQAGRELEALLNRHQDTLPPLERSTTKIMLADSLSEIDRARGAAILKEVALNEAYPAGSRALAISFIVNDYELDFIDRDFAEKELFTGPVFGDLLREANGDVELAVRKLNEWAVAIFPYEIIARYRIARWYAAELYKNPQMPTAQRLEFQGQVNRYLAEGDRLLERFKNVMPAQRLGLAYELKARATYLSGGSVDEAGRLFRLAAEAYLGPPHNIFQMVYLMRSGLYHAAFLQKNYGPARAEEIRAILGHYYRYLATPRPPPERNVRLVSFLIAARDSDRPDYPAVDFNRAVLDSLFEIYPEFEVVVNGLDLKEYVKGHPLEAQLGS
jgi:hypothetical protein